MACYNGMGDNIKNGLFGFIMSIIILIITIAGLFNDRACEFSKAFISLYITSYAISRMIYEIIERRQKEYNNKNNVEDDK